MRKGIVIWILILAALIGTMVLTAPNFSNAYKPSHTHTYEWSDNCRVGSCRCGEKLYYPAGSHSFEQTDCFEKTCRQCGFTQTNTTHLGWCSSFANCPTCGQEVSLPTGQTYHNMVYDKNYTCTTEGACTICGISAPPKVHHRRWKYSSSEDCKQITTCADCGVTMINNLVTRHTWTSDNCENGTVCSNCDKSGPSTHNFENGFLRVFDRCTQCDLPLYMTSDFNLPVLLAEIFGVLLTAFAFEYAIRRRKYMKINWWLILRAWVNDTLFASDFRPAVLLKKELRN